VPLVLAALLLIVPLPAEAQPARQPYRIGVVNEAFAATHPTVEGLKAGLREAGLVVRPADPAGKMDTRRIGAA
jgi:hypothetical protein